MSPGGVLGVPGGDFGGGRVHWGCWGGGTPEMSQRGAPGRPGGCTGGTQGGARGGGHSRLSHRGYWGVEGVPLGCNWGVCGALGGVHWGCLGWARWRWCPRAIHGGAAGCPGGLLIGMPGDVPLWGWALWGFGVCVRAGGALSPCGCGAPPPPRAAHCAQPAPRAPRSAQGPAPWPRRCHRSPL